MKTRQFAVMLVLTLIMTSGWSAGQNVQTAPARPRSAADITVAAYYYSCTHPHPKWDKQEYPGFTEWDLVKKAKPRFAGHRQPRIPVWGYQDESDPNVMAQKIDAAADYGVDVFIFDWYYHDQGPFLERALDEGYLKAANNSRLRFGLMWANHDWQDIQGYNPAEPVKTLYPGKVTPQTWEAITDLVIERYFRHPSYWKIDGKPYFSIYEVGKFLDSFGSIETARAAMDRFREKTTAAGFPGLHLNVILWGQPRVPVTGAPLQWPELCKAMAVDSLTGYTWVHYGALNGSTFPVSDYVWGRDRYLQFLDNALKDSSVPYFPNTTVNWDNTARAHPDADWSKPAAHVVNPVMQGNTPAAFKEATEMIVRRLLASSVEPKILTVNAWNEWPEGSTLEPEQEYGFGYLEAIREIFGANPNR